MTDDDPLPDDADWTDDLSTNGDSGTAEDDQTPDEPDGPTARDYAERAGEAIAAVPLYLAATIIGLLGGIASAVLGKLPKRTAVYRGMIKAGYKNLYKQTDAHVVANTIYGDGELKPMAAQVDTETGHLETTNGEMWTTDGLQPVRIGDAPVVTGVADDHELVDHIAARVAEARDYSDQRWQEVQQTKLGVEPTASMTTAGASAQAATDGGALSTPDLTTFDDIWLDASNPVPENDGWIVSMQKAYDLHWDQAGSEEMQNQEVRGILSEKDPRKDRRQMIIIAAMILGAFCLGLFGPALAANIAGEAAGAASGGGGGVPLVLGWLL
jgi:hypothetical protein